jgi:glycosyltransferase involved in cell wall biosynthesis
VNPKVSVIITTLNRLAFLREAIASVRGQEGTTHELIVVDNGSSDGTSEWLRAEPGLTALRAEPDPGRSRSGNISIARNTGFESARGQYVWFLDDDDRLRPGALALLARALDEQTDAVAAVGARTRFGEDVVGGRVGHPLRRIVRHLGPEILLGWGWIPSQALCRATTLREAGGWREDVPHAEDLDMWARVAGRGPVVLVPETVLEYRVHRAQSRLRDPTALRDLLIQPHLAELAGGDRARGELLRQAGRWWDRANAAFGREEFPRALAYTLRAGVLAPVLLRSPATGPLATRMLVRAALRSLGPSRRWIESRAQRPPPERPRRGTGFLS